MTLLVVIVFFLFVGSAESEVMQNFDNCKDFFYKDSPPRGLETVRAMSICQVYQNAYRFASLYSIEKRIPLFSAYRLDTFTCPAEQPSRRSQWFIEPQLTGQGDREMKTEGTMSDVYKTVQAINVDFPNTNYDRGHLNPNFYQCDESRTATFTLTNAVPQDPCFNQQRWKEMEEMAKYAMQSHCNFPGAKRYFITGAVPSDTRIPSQAHDKESDRRRDYERVSIPSVMWTAACCDSSTSTFPQDRNKGFSFGYYGENKPEILILPLTVAQLEEKLARDYNIRTFNVFADSCFSDSDNSNTVLRKMRVPIERQLAQVLVDFSQSSESSVQPEKEKLMENIQKSLQPMDEIAMKDWRFADADFGMKVKRDNIQNTRDLLATVAMTLVLTPFQTAKSVSIRSVTFKSDTSVRQQNGDEYIVVDSTDKRFSARTSRCREDHPCDFYGEPYSWCYIDWDGNSEYCCTSPCGFGKDTEYSWCYSGKLSNWDYCSQRSSMVSVSGKKCLDDHECGLHSKAYHWCYTDLVGNWEYCCQPWHECSYHGTDYKWCYVHGRRNRFAKRCYY